MIDIPKWDKKKVLVNLVTTPVLGDVLYQDSYIFENLPIFRDIILDPYSERRKRLFPGQFYMFSEWSHNKPSYFAMLCKNNSPDYGMSVTSTQIIDIPQVFKLRYEIVNIERMLELPKPRFYRELENDPGDIECLIDYVRCFCVVPIAEYMRHIYSS